MRARLRAYACEMEQQQVRAEGVSGVLHVPGMPKGGALVLTHGAGGNCEAPLLRAVAAEFCGRGLHVLRCDLPFRQRRGKGPPAPAGAAEDRAGLRCAALWLAQRSPGPIRLGGHSYGGRQASLLLADEPEIAAALLLLSYPLHPPEKPQQLRVQHFPRLRRPALFVHGSRDPFATPAELADAIAAIPAPAAIFTVEGAGHDLRRGSFDLGAMASRFLAGD